MHELKLKMLAQLLLMAMVPPSFSSAQHDPGWSGSGGGGSESRGGSEPGGFLGNVVRSPVFAPPRFSSL